MNKTAGKVVSSKFVVVPNVTRSLPWSAVAGSHSDRWWQMLQRLAIALSCAEGVVSESVSVIVGMVKGFDDVVVYSTPSVEETGQMISITYIERDQFYMCILRTF
jgi:hypothetical protein